MGSSAWMLLAVAAAALFVTGEALQCHYCNNAHDCNDGNFATSGTGVSQISDISGNNCEYCYKAKTTTFGRSRVQRGCYTVVSDEYIHDTKCYHEESDDGTKVEYCYCNSDDCNSASSVAWSAFSLGVMFLVAKLFQ